LKRSVTLAIVRGKWLVAPAAVLASLVAGGFWLHSRKPPAPPANASASTVVLPPSITITGKIRAAHVTAVGAELPGTIDEFEVNVGDEVFQGQVLAQIGSAGMEAARSEAAAEVEKAQNRVESAEKIYAAAQLEASRAHADAERSRAEYDRITRLFDRQKTLFRAGATPRLTYEKTERDFASAQQEFDAVEKAESAARDHVQNTLKELDNAKRVLAGKNQELESAQSAVLAAVVESPVDGLVVARQGEVGQAAQELGAGLFQIATDLFDLEVVIEPKPEMRKRIRPHQPALVIIPDLESTGYPGEIKAIEDNQVVIAFQSPTPAIRPGMVADVRLKPE
jgi:multidrug efflux pump subunit AcrA (membrane-fusion protein)